VVYPGVTKIGKGQYRIRATATDPRTGKQREADRVVEAASAAEASSMRALLRQEIVSRVERAPRMTVADFAESWLRSKRSELAPSTQETYATALDQMGWLGDMYIDTVIPVDVLKWRDGLKGKPATVNGYLRVVKTMLADAMVQLRLPHNPAERVRGKRDKRSREEVDSNRLTAPELGRVLEVAKTAEPQWHALFATLALTGARWGEVSALRWTDVDLDGGEVVFRRAQWRGELKELKTDQIRRVPIIPMLAETLRAHRQRLLKQQDRRRLASGLVFPSNTGTLLRNGGGVGRPWARVLKTGGVSRRITIHGLRRTFNNLARQVSSALVTQAMTGHVTDAMTEHYSHVEQAEKRAAVAQIGRMVSQSSGDRSGDTQVSP
jgi:integrase